MIKVISLPVRGLDSVVSKRFGKGILERFHPRGKSVGIRQVDKEMKMVGHDDVAADEDVAFTRCGTKCFKGPVNMIIGQKWTAIMSAAGDEEDGAIVVDGV